MEQILIRPVLTETATASAETANRYTFVVDKKANKVEIKKAVEQAYKVNVENVRTMIAPAKSIVRNTKSGVLKGRKPSVKKAVIEVRAGETIDIYANL